VVGQDPGQSLRLALGSVILSAASFLAFVNRKLVSFEHRESSMQRLIAKFLLLVVLVGNFAPLALAATAAPHACCVRKAAHRCHDSLTSEQVSETGQLIVRDTGSCNHDCCRAVTTARWAHAQSRASASFVRHIEAYLGESSSVPANTEVPRFQSTRAPPSC
jgi:hypothetical protein